MNKTTDNLKAAFAGESQANRRYLAFAQKAENDGKPGIAKLFRAAAEGETVHALNHMRTLGETKTTAENLTAAIGGETYEIDEMYPGFVSAAAEENATAAKLSFENALAVEKIHQALFQKALERLEAGEDMTDEDYYICPVCGFPALKEAPDVCPICHTPKDKFRQL